MGQRAKIAFEKTTFNMGLVQENGGKVTHEFKFTNKGKAPLLIKFIETTCGCTTPKWNRKPIPPGDSGVVTVTFNPKDRPGVFSKKNYRVHERHSPEHRIAFRRRSHHEIG